MSKSIIFLEKILELLELRSNQLILLWKLARIWWWKDFWIKI